MAEGNEEPKQQPDKDQEIKRLKSELEQVKAELADSKQQNATLNESLEAALTEDDVKSAVENAKAEYEKAATEAAGKAAVREKRLKVENELIKANCIDTTSALAHIDLEAVDVAQDGHISGLDIAGLAESHAHLFQSQNVNKRSAGEPGGSNKLTKEEILAIENPAKRRQAIAENLDVFNKE